MCCFQTFQLTALVVKGPSELHPFFTVSLSGVAISHEKVKGAVACVQDFLRHPLSTQTKLFLRDWDQHAEHCRYCRRCCSEQFKVWSLRSNWCRGWPRNCRSEVVQRENCITKGGSHRYTGALVWCRNFCLISCWWGCAPHDCPYLSVRWCRRCAIFWGAR